MTLWPATSMTNTSATANRRASRAVCVFILDCSRRFSEHELQVAEPHRTRIHDFKSGFAKQMHHVGRCDVPMTVKPREDPSRLPRSKIDDEHASARLYNPAHLARAPATGFA